MRTRGKICFDPLVEAIHGLPSEKYSQFVVKQFSASGRNYTAARPRVPERVPSAGQIAAQSMFTAAVEAAKRVLSNPDELAEYVVRFKNQRRYSTLRGFLVATLYGEIAAANHIEVKELEESSILDDELAQQLLDNYYNKEK